MRETGATQLPCDVLLPDGRRVRAHGVDQAGCVFSKTGVLARETIASAVFSAALVVNGYQGARVLDGVLVSGVGLDLSDQRHAAQVAKFNDWRGAPFAPNTAFVPASEYDALRLKAKEERRREAALGRPDRLPCEVRLEDGRRVVASFVDASGRVISANAAPDRVEVIALGAEPDAVIGDEDEETPRVHEGVLSSPAGFDFSGARAPRLIRFNDWHDESWAPDKLWIDPRTHERLTAEQARREAARAPVPEASTAVTPIVRQPNQTARPEPQDDAGNRCAPTHVSNLGPTGGPVDRLRRELLDMPGQELSKELRAVDRRTRTGATPSEAQVAVLRRLWASGPATLRQIQTVHFSGKVSEWARQQMVELHRNEYVQRFGVHTRSGAVPQVFVLDRAGRDLLAQVGLIEASTSTKFVMRVPANTDGPVQHDLRANAWVIALLEKWGPGFPANEERWYGPRECKLTPPRSARDLADLKEAFGVQGTGTSVLREINPDAGLLMPAGGGTRFVFVEYERFGFRKMDHLPVKFAKYDTFLTYWWRLGFVSEVRLDTQPMLLVVADDEKVLAHVMRDAHAQFTARTTKSDPYGQRHVTWRGRDAVHFALADDIHRGRLRLWQLPREHSADRHSRAAASPAARERTFIGTLVMDSSEFASMAHF